jgi:hypothetical protein
MNADDTIFRSPSDTPSSPEVRSPRGEFMTLFPLNRNRGMRNAN